MIKRLSKCIREYWRDTILTPTLVIGEVIMEVLMPLFMARLIDNGIEKANGVNNRKKDFHLYGNCV